MYVTIWISVAVMDCTLFSRDAMKSNVYVLELCLLNALDVDYGLNVMLL